MPRISEYFRDSPFLTIAGRIGLDTGRDDFVCLEPHEILQKETENYLNTKPISIRLLVSGSGGGKTWTLSWLWRQFSTKPDTIVIGVPRVELRGQPDRGFMEAIFRALWPDLGNIVSRIDTLKGEFPQSLRKTPTHYVWEALQDSSAYAQLCGTSGKLPVLKDLNPPSMTKTEGTLQLLLGLFRVLFITGFKHVLILVDEVENIFIAYGRRDLFIFSDFIRNIFDEFQSDRGRFLPKLQILLAGTSHVLEMVSPGLVGKQTEAGDITQALIRRLDAPFTLSFLGQKKDVLKIAEHRIGVHRKRALNQPYIPYDEKAILYAWDHSLGNLGIYCYLLQLMYDIALNEKAKRITLTHAKKVVSEYETMQAPVT